VRVANRHARLRSRRVLFDEAIRGSRRLRRSAGPGPHVEAFHFTRVPPQPVTDTEERPRTSPPDFVGAFRPPEEPQRDVADDNAGEAPRRVDQHVTHPWLNLALRSRV